MTVAASVRSALPASVRSALAARLGVDRRALAAFRVALAAVVLVDLALRLPDVRAFYTDAGVLPRSLLLETFPTLGRLTVHTLFGGVWWQLVLFAATAAAALALAAGYRTRLATVATLALLVSLQLRNPVLLNAGDSLLRRLLLWSALLPLGARWSVDARRRDANSARRSPAEAGTASASSDRLLSVAGVGLLVQVLAVYVVNALLKARGSAWHEGVAGRLALGMDALTVLLGDVVAGVPVLLTLGTYAWLVLLAASPLLVLATGRTRTAIVAGLAGGHVAMALSLRLGAFPLVSVAALLPFLPPAVWDRVERAVDDHLADRETAAAHRAATVAERIPAFAGGGGRLPSLPASLELPEVARDVGSASARTVAVVLLAFVLVWNAAGLGLLALPAEVTATVDPEERRWDMFAPEPRSTGGWYVTTGTTTDGERVDAFAGIDATGDPGASDDASTSRDADASGVGNARTIPADVDGTYPSHRWYVYLTALRDAPAPALRDRFGAYLCERWNRRHDATLASVNVTFVERTVRLDAPDRITVRPFGTTDCTPAANATTDRRSGTAP